MVVSVAFQGLGQVAPALPQFEVASVKPAPSREARIGLFTYPGGRIVVSNYTLTMLIHDAYSVQDDQILNAPRWATEQLYYVEAKPPGSSESSKWIPANIKTPPNPEMRQMLQSLLVDRFSLKVHFENKADTVYALVVAKGGHKLKAPTPGEEPFVSYERTGSAEQAAVSLLLRGRNATLTQLVARLTAQLKRPVLDETGLSGNFDFQVEYAAELQQFGNAPTLPRALQEQLGLKLEPRPGTRRVLVVDHAEKPSLN